MRSSDGSAKAAAGPPFAEQMAAAFEAADRGDYHVALDIWAPLAHARG